MGFDLNDLSRFFIIIINVKGELEFLKSQQILKKHSPEEMGVALPNAVTINGVPMNGQAITVNYGNKKDEQNKKIPHGKHDNIVKEEIDNE